jgi:Protein of unknown function (DUF1549)/Protein of unknown function (DUF1553)
MTSLAVVWALGMTALAPSAPRETSLAEVRGRLDTTIASRWKELELAPEAPVADEAFLRRVWLDLAGRVPPEDQVRSFLDDQSAAKRERLVDRLLASPEFAEHWARQWTISLTGQRPFPGDGYDGRLLMGFLKESLHSGKSYRRIVTELLTAEGLGEENGQVQFILRYKARPIELTGAVSKHMLGVSLQCAQCHDHPFADWKQTDFWGVAGFFGRVRIFDSLEDDDGQVLKGVFETRSKEYEIVDMAAKPDKDGNRPRKRIQPRLPGGQAEAATGNRRKALAQWITADGNPYFARHLVNRAWSQLFGRALVRELDRPHADTDGWHPRVLDLLAEDFAAGDYSLQRLLRVIVLSRTYAVSAGDGALASDEAADAARLKKIRNFARMPVRPLGVDALHQSIVQATGHQVKQEDPNGDLAMDELTEHAQTLQRSLALLNGGFIQDAARVRVERLVKERGEEATAAHIEELFLATLARRPTKAETTRMLGFVKEAADVRIGLEDILWGLLNSVEFTTTH